MRCVGGVVGVAITALQRTRSVMVCPVCGCNYGWRLQRMNASTHAAIDGTRYRLQLAAVITIEYVAATSERRSMKEEKHCHGSIRGQ